MKKFLLYSLLIPLLFYSNIYAKSNQKEIQLPGNIKYVWNSDNYMAVICKTDKSYNRAVLLFDKNGNKVFEKYFEDYFVHQVIINEKYQFIIIVSSLIGNNQMYCKQEAFNINTGSVAWNTKINSIEFEQSPDKEKLLTTVAPFETSSTLEIIKIKDGFKYTPSIKSWDNVAWLDSRRIIVVNLIMETNPEYLKIQNDKGKVRSELIKQKHYLMRAFNLGEVTQDEYERQLKQIDDEIKNTSIKRTTDSGRRKKRLVEKWGKIGTIVKIYNIETHQAELEKEIYDVNGKEIGKERDDENRFCLTVDENGGIFLYGFQKDEKNTIRENFLFKFDRVLKPIWKSKIMRDWSRPARLIYNNKKEIIINNGGKIVGMFDKKTGEIQRNFPNLSNLMIVNFNDLSYTDIININGYQLHKNSNVIRFNKSKSE